MVKKMKLWCLVVAMVVASASICFSTVTEVSNNAGEVIYTYDTDK